ncbi:unnamed protein product [Amoebophrya sp. A25]|nr:unnamed protein product [Amoebophrya sp. A25]|eukprot:GSA25T00001362001.1
MNEELLGRGLTAQERYNLTMQIWDQCFGNSKVYQAYRPQQQQGGQSSQGGQGSSEGGQSFQGGHCQVSSVHIGQGFQTGVDCFGTIGESFYREGGQGVDQHGAGQQQVTGGDQVQPDDDVFERRQSSMATVIVDVDNRPVSQGVANWIEGLRLTLERSRKESSEGLYGSCS